MGFWYDPGTHLKKIDRKQTRSVIRIIFSLKKSRYHFAGNWSDLILWFVGKNTLEESRTLSRVKIRLLCPIILFDPKKLNSTQNVNQLCVDPQNKFAFRRIDNGIANIFVFANISAICQLYLSDILTSLLTLHSWNILDIWKRVFENKQLTCFCIKIPTIIKNHRRIITLSFLERHRLR